MTLLELVQSGREGTEPVVIFSGLVESILLEVGGIVDLGGTTILPRTLHLKAVDEGFTALNLF